jgi:hypothetical protein
MNPLIHVRKATPVFFVALALACLALRQRAQATDWDGVLPGGSTADGVGVLADQTSGSGNSGFGYLALRFLTDGSDNTAMGDIALFNNHSGKENTAIGSGALSLNDIDGMGFGSENSAFGYYALVNNIDGRGNSAFGWRALATNYAGSQNAAIGYRALVKNIIGNFNTAIGNSALAFNNTGSSNTALGFAAGSNVTTAENVICIGTPGANVSNSCYVGQIFNTTSSGGTAVFINSDGKLGTSTSSQRFKEEIKPMDKASESILALKPVTFRYKHELDPDHIPQFGLVAEEVEKVNPDLVVRDKEGKPYSVRYDQVNAMLLNEFLKEHGKVEKLEAAFARQQKQIEALTAGLQKVSAQLKVSKPAPQTVLNNH